ncbi:CaiB/BaiF CoA transferase family protein [Sphingomonas sp. Leaf30]|uniref:CaiB/BaiF CoA transferase family protein n=1 Tax=Sphingomonas sp. Leaf30 TaxID=1736213 RepID=UPI0009EAB013|nr:CoA transferase [Sphingomonas sp. Leaf30]
MRPLEGIRVVDLTHAVSGPTCTLMLAQLGADVVKIEPPERGDDFRDYTEHGGLAKMSIPFAAINAGKRSVALDLKSDEGRAALDALVMRGDVLVENFRPGVLARLGFSNDRLRALNPRLVIAAISGFGQSGPLRDWGAYDHIAQAMSGMAMMEARSGEPRKIGIPVIDSFSGYLAVIGILAALRTRDATGNGGDVDIAMLDAALKLMATNLAVESFTGVAPAGTGNRGYRLVATAEYYPTAKGWIALGANHQHQVEALWHVLGRADLINDPRFATHPARVEHYDALRALIVELLSSEYAVDLEARLTQAGIPAAMLRDVGQAARHPHIVDRGLIVRADVPGADRDIAVVGPGFTIDASTEPWQVPTIGQHTAEVLAELGLAPWG